VADPISDIFFGNPKRRKDRRRRDLKLQGEFERAGFEFPAGEDSLRWIVQ